MLDAISTYLSHFSSLTPTQDWFTSKNAMVDTQEHSLRDKSLNCD